MKLFMIARCNIRRNRSMTFTLVVLIIFAAILLYIGTSVMFGMGSFLDRKNSELNGSAFTVFAPLQYETAVKASLSKLEGYEKLENEKAVSSYATFQNLTLKGKNQSMGCLLLNADQKEEISQLKIIDKGDKKLSNSIVLPYYLKLAKGYKTGDEMSITYNGKQHNYIIYGFAEDIMFAIPSNVSYYKCYIYEDEFNKLYEEDDNTKYFLLKTIMPEGTDTVKYENRFIKELNNKVKDSTSMICAMDYNSMKVGVSIFFTIIMIFLIVFSMIIILIALTVIRFAVVTHIEGNIQNIGSMEALGYTGKELVLSTVLQFAMIALISTLIGLGIAISCAGIVTKLVSSSIGLIWCNGTNLLAIVINLVLVMTLVMLISYLTAAKIKKITPIMALRSGIDTHNFRKNYFPLGKYGWNLSLLMGLKTLMHNMKQNITVFIIVTLMSFVCVFAFTTDYNFIVNNTALLRLIGLEKSNLLINDIGEDSLQLFDNISRMDEVRKTIRLTNVGMTVYSGDEEVTPAVNVCNDYEMLEINTIVKGRYPVHDNEIAVTSLILKELKVKLGDSVTLKGTSQKADYIIVGITQQISHLGKGANITEEGMKRINPDFVPTDLYVYLKDKKDTTQVIAELEEKYGDRAINVTNMVEEFDGIMDSFNKAITALCIGCIVITLFIISLVLFLLIKIKLIKERMRIGVSKALGFTTKQLILQVISSFFPVCALGALLGTIMATYFINPVLAAMLSLAGSIENCHFTVSFQLTSATFLSISLFSVIISALIATSVRKITPCELFR